MTGRTRFIVGTTVAIVVASVAAVAFAYFTSSTTGGGTATTASLQPVTVAALTGGDTPSSKLAPGSSADVVLRIQNLNPFSVTLTDVTGGPGAITADAGHAGCTTTGVTFTNQTGLSVSIAASGTTLVHLANAASMSNASSNGCQGATFSIPVTTTVRR